MTIGDYIIALARNSEVEPANSRSESPEISGFEAERWSRHAIHNADVPGSSPGVATIIFKGLAKANPFSFWAAITKRQQPGPPSRAPQAPASLCSFK